jgi:serine protease Do
MEDIVLLNAIERYIAGEMLPEEKAHFELLRKDNAEVDQLVVEHIFFRRQLDRYQDRREFKAALGTIHESLVKDEQIHIDNPKQPGKLVSLWNRHKRNIAIAASIAGIVWISALSLILAYSKGSDNNKDIITLRSEFKKEIGQLNDKIEKTTKNTPITTATFGGTGFLIDGSGILITNQHVVGSKKEIYVFNEKFGNLRARVLKTDALNDIAVLQITDTSFKSYKKLPYSIRKTEPELGQNVYTLGFPRPELIYSEGYISSQTATGVSKNPSNFFLTIRVDEGNSGSPIINNRGEILGVINAKEKNPNGFALGIKAQVLADVLDELKKDKIITGNSLSAKSSLGGQNRPEQVKKFSDYIFMMEVE